MNKQGPSHCFHLHATAPPMAVPGWVDERMVSWILDIHYIDVIMGAIASQITPASSLFTQVADQRKHQSSASLAFVRGLQWSPVNSPHKWHVTWKMFPFDDVIMHCCKQCFTSMTYKNLFNINSSMKWFFMTWPAYSDQAPLWTKATPLVLSWPRMDQWCGYESAAFLTRTSFTNTLSAHNPKSWIMTWIILCRIRIQSSLNFVHVMTTELIYLFCLLCILCKVMLYWIML